MLQTNGPKIIEIIGRIYEAAEDPVAWSSVLRMLGGSFGSTVNVFTMNDTRSPLSRVAVSDGGDPKWEQEYNDYYYSTNIVFKRMAPILTTGRVLCSDDVLSESELLGSEYYQDFLRRGDVFHLLGSVIMATSNSNAVLTLARSRKLGPWSADDKDAIALLTPHLQRAVRLCGKFARVQQERADLLNRLSMGIAVLDDAGKIEFCNRAAEAIFITKDGLYCHSNRILAVDVRQAARLGKMISSATLTACGKSTAGGGSLSISRSSNGSPLSVFVAPMMPTASSSLSASPRVAVFITDHEANRQSNCERLTALFDLTPAESRMASQLLQGDSVAEAALALGITDQTARVHLKRIFCKTYTSRQSELMMLLLSSPAALQD